MLSPLQVLLQGNSNVLAVGYNHLHAGKVLHAEQHALRRFQSKLRARGASTKDVQEWLARRDVSMTVVELCGDVTYDDAVPCGACNIDILRNRMLHVHYSNGCGGVSSLNFS